MSTGRLPFAIGTVTLVAFVGVAPSSHAQEPPVGSVYVATDGSDTNPGTIDQPWKTIQKAADSVDAGATVYVRGGVYNGAVTINVSGTPGDPITFRSHPGETAIIDGSNLTPPPGTSALVDIRDQSHLVVQDLEVRNYSTNARTSFPIGIFVAGTGEDIQLLDNHVHDIETLVGDRHWPVIQEWVDKWFWRGDAHGIAVYGTGAPQGLTNIVIDGNTVDSLKLGSSESLVVNGNVDGFRITDNLVHDANNIGIDVIGFEGKAADPAYDQARNGVIADNTVYNIDSFRNPAYGRDRSAGCIYVDGGTRLTVERNAVHDCNIGIELASEHAGRATSDITLRNNLVYHNTSMGITIGGYDNKRGSTENCTITNNTLHDNDYRQEGNGELLLQYDTRDNVISNNIFVANDQNLLLSNPYTKNMGNVVDHNLYFAPGGELESMWQWKNETYTGFATYQAQTGNDQHGLFADPRLASTSALDLHVQPGSPAIDRGGTPSASGDMDIDGQPRAAGEAIDIGADEVP